MTNDEATQILHVLFDRHDVEVTPAVCALWQQTVFGGVTFDDALEVAGDIVEQFRAPVQPVDFARALKRLHSERCAPTDVGRAEIAAIRRKLQPESESA
jgi:hypothetical protein